jgi:hypothetical protein
MLLSDVEKATFKPTETWAENIEIISGRRIQVSQLAGMTGGNAPHMTRHTLWTSIFTLSGAASNKKKGPARSEDRPAL